MATEVTLPAELALELEEDFRSGPIVNDQGQRYLAEVEVGRLGGLVIVIQFDEHPPPHFEVRHQGEKASYSIADGTRLPKIRGLERFDRNVRKWWKKHMCLLVKTWNETRPSDCQVGFMVVPPECMEPATR